MSARDAEGAFAPGLYVVDSKTGDSWRIVSMDSLGWAGAWWLQWSPKGDDRLLFWANGSIGILDVSTGAREQLTFGQHDENLPSWSPSGDSVLFWRSKISYQPDSLGGLYFVRPGSMTQHRFVSRDGAVTWSVDRVAYSPDGAWMAYTIGAPGPDGLPGAAYEIVAMRSDGSDRRQLTHLQGWAKHPQWVGPDEIVFDYAPFECTGVGTPVVHTWAVRLNGEAPRRWSTDLVDARVRYSWLPAISRDLRRAAVIQYDERLDGGNLFVMSLVGPPFKREVFKRW